MGLLGLLTTPARRLDFPVELDAAFTQEYAADSLKSLRWAIWVGILLFAGFGPLAPWIVPEIKVEAWILQYAVICPVLLIAWALTFTPFVLDHIHQLFAPLVSLGILIAGGGIIVLTAMLAPGNAAGLSYSGVLVLVVIFSYSAVRMPFAWAWSINWILFPAYLMAAIYGSNALEHNTTRIVLFSNTAILIGANLIGMFACYTLEFYARLDFLQKRSIRKEKDTSEKLLLNILPREVADTLKTRGNPIAQDFPEATLLFSDICDFTPLSSTLSPLELLKLLNEVFSAFDEIVDRNGGEKIKTIGDCYMVTVGVPTPVAGHARIAARIAMEMQEYLTQRAAEHQDGEFVLKMRSGMHSGPVVAGVIGHSKFIYDLWGDTVNTASRMESHSEPGKIQITRETYERIKDEFECESRGTIHVKGKGDMEAWYIKNWRKRG
ncbi:adenylate cyclase [Sinimarinibacterium sp. NLF-5-8]|uniref:adenylate cyclase n=1 Tax=Sinimarinibacterium sp. NLF-5-8 TaxID=2698684 RepID=UPI00137C16D0|nr:adenylate cyclase [Sinimarinibacterium sp. NLF-5-8]QHS09552.1 hypothetical protein GT972_04845 [Sinimarinibacterium sp. NLF-5-8]